MGKKEGRNYTWVIVLFVIVLVIAIFFGMTKVFLSLLFNQETLKTGNVAVIPISGPIVTESEESVFAPSGLAVSSRIVDKIKKAEEDVLIRAIIIEINSPGGSPVGSDEIAFAIEESKKPVVALIREMGASGGYWVAAPADVIVAHRNSLVGSIGVIASYVEFPDLLTRFNITYNRLVAGKYKDVGSPLKKMKEDEEALFQSLLDELYEDFISHVAKHRKLEPEQVKELATGWIYTGRKAKELGLVDELGGMEKAEEIIERDLNITVELVEYQTQPSFFEILAGTGQVGAYQIGKGIGESLITRAEQPSTLKVLM